MTTYARKRSWLPDIELGPPKMSQSVHAEGISQTSLKFSAHRSHMSENFSNQTLSLKRPRLVQTTIDLGGATRKTCRKCGMQYVPSAVEDARAHERYCATTEVALVGVEISLREFDSCRKVQLCNPVKMTGKMNHSLPTINDSGSRSNNYILEVTRRSSSKPKGFAQRMLKIVEYELGSVNIAEDTLWGMIQDPSSCNSKHEAVKHDAFKAYLYVANGRCLGLCLAQRIWKARKVTASCVARATDVDGTLRGGANNTDMDLHTTSYCTDGAITHTVVLGISRIWVAPCVRNKGIAKDMLNVVREWFLIGRTLSKCEIAFSQPTESGLRLARKWQGMGSGWCVYDEGSEES